MHVRPYEDADEAAVIALWNAVLPPTAPHNDPATSIRMKRAYERELFYIAETDGGVVGTVMGGYDGHRGWVYSVAVRPDHQRRGIGRLLLRRLEADFAARGCMKINLQVRAANAAVIGFYESLGYKVEEILSLGKRLYS